MTGGRPSGHVRGARQENKSGRVGQVQVGTSGKCNEERGLETQRSGLEWRQALAEGG